MRLGLAQSPPEVSGAGQGSKAVRMARPRRFDPDDTLDRAVEQFWEKGFDGVHVLALCRAMGLNPGSLYGAFGDKRAVFLASFDRYAATVSRDAIRRIAEAPSGFAGIERYFAHLVDSILDGRRRWGCLATNATIELAARDPEIAAKVRDHFGRLEAAFAEALARAAAEGEIVPAQAAAAPFLVSVVQGLNVLAKTKPSRERLEIVIRMALGAFARPKAP